MRTEVIDSMEKLSARSMEWDRLALSNEQSQPYQLSGWVIAYFEKRLKNNEQWTCSFIYDDAGELIGALPMVSKTLHLPGKNIRILSTPWDLHMMCGDMIWNSRERNKLAEIFQCAIQAMKDYYPDCFCIKFRRVPETALENRWLGKESHYYLISGQEHGDYVSMQGSFISYYKNLSANFRRNLRKSTRKIRKEQSFEYRHLSGDTVNETTLQEFFEVENSGWKRKSGTSIASSKNLVDFYKEAVGRLAKAGFAELHFLKINDQTAAGHLTVRIKRSIFLLKIGYEQAYARFSPGNLLMLNLLEQSFCGDIDRIDCMTSGQWHKKWNMKQTQYYSVHVYPKTIIPMIFGMLPRSVYIKMRSVLFKPKSEVVRRVQPAGFNPENR